MYGCGLRLMEACRLRVQDIDFAMHQIIVRESKGNKHRTTVLPDSLIDPLKYRIAKTKLIHEFDLARGYGKVYLPSGTALRPGCWRMDTICGRYRNCWDTAISA